MIIFILGADRTTDARLTVDSISLWLPLHRVVPVPAGSVHIANEALEGASDSACMTIRAGSIIHEGIKGSMEQFAVQLERDTLPWVHLLTDEEASVLKSKFRPGEAGPILWNLRMMKEMGLSFLCGSPYPFDGLMEWQLMHLMSRTTAGRSVRSKAWAPPRRKFKDWQRKELEWVKLAPFFKPLNNALNPFENAAIPKVSIVLAVYNEADYFRWAAQSVISQSSASWQLLLIDDGSTDDTPAWMEQLAAEEPERIHYVRLARNVGKAAALNAALPHVRAPWLLELDADDWLDADCVEKWNKIASVLNRDTVLVYGNHAEWRQDITGNLSYRGTYSCPERLNGSELLQAGVPLAPRLMRTETLRMLGGWRTDDPVAGRLYEDMHMILRLLQAGGAFCWNECVYNRRIRFNSITRKNQEQYAKWCAWARTTYLI